MVNMDRNRTISIVVLLGIAAVLFWCTKEVYYWGYEDFSEELVRQGHRGELTPDYIRGRFLAKMYSLIPFCFAVACAVYALAKALRHADAKDVSERKL